MKVIILAGSPNVGKTQTTNLVIQKLIKNGFCFGKYFHDNSVNNFWEVKTDNKFTAGGSVMLCKKDYKIAVVSYGDNLKYIPSLFKDIEKENPNVIICCSHATRGKQVFDWFHKYIAKFDLNKDTIIPLFKNMLSCHENNNIENESMANIIVDLIK